MKLRIKATNVKICVVINSKQPNEPSSATGDPKPSPATAELQAPTPVGCSDLLGVRVMTKDTAENLHHYWLDVKPYKNQ
jgi:hypothetical protein